MAGVHSASPSHSADTRPAASYIMCSTACSKNPLSITSCTYTEPHVLPSASPSHSADTRLAASCAVYTWSTMRVQPCDTYTWQVCLLLPRRTALTRGLPPPARSVAPHAANTCTKLHPRSQHAGQTHQARQLLPSASPSHSTEIRLAACCKIGSRRSVTRCAQAAKVQ
jgi:hypothetical protein